MGSPPTSLEDITKLLQLTQCESIAELTQTVANASSKDEFDQRESVTTQIADTLDRYPVETTFREYLANADDTSGATRVSWLLDERQHACQSLLTPEMEKLQGPALLVYNNGVFIEEDFEGLKHVGVGSKRQNKTVIGQFGRGSQTMYHWTDTPMILSGGHLLILDPQQQVLPQNGLSGKRMSGIKYSLEKVRQSCPSHLAPFDGLWGFSPQLDNYDGTIFRFPLRRTSDTSILSPSACHTTAEPLTSDQRPAHLNGHEAIRLMDEYFSEARISLLFLRRIKSIDFRVHGLADSGWSVSKKVLPTASGQLSHDVLCSFDKGTGPESLSGTDRWWVGIEDLQPESNRLPEATRRIMKNAECGLAALIYSEPCDQSASLSKPIQSRLFSTLPLPIPADLPVHIHATFSLSGDRQAIAIDEEGPKSHNSKWNRFLFQEALPKLYLEFLDDVGLQFHQNVFTLWPRDASSERTCAGLLCASFWKLISQSSRRLFPKAGPTSTLPQRRVGEMVSLQEATFDFMPENQSKLLAPLLMSLGVKLVCDIPKDISKLLKALPGVQSVDGPMLRTTFKSQLARDQLLTQLKARPEVSGSLVDALLAAIIPPVADYLDLVGCHILPLADGTLATLNTSEDNTSNTYYVATDEELELFSFASKRLLTTRVAKKLGYVTENGKFNILQLALCHVEELLKTNAPVTSPDAEHDSWLRRFWEYWNDHPNSTNSQPSLDKLDVPIFKATCDGLAIYSTPLKFASLPAIVEPNEADQLPLCTKVPGLHLLDPGFMPTMYAQSEASFSQLKSFNRLLDAWKMLAGSTTLGKFLRKHLDTADFEELKHIVVEHVGKLISPVDIHGPLHAHFDDIRSMPLWPSAANKQSLLSADNALLASDTYLMAAWMKMRAQFVHADEVTFSTLQKRCLLRLNVQEISTKDLLENYVLPLPKTLGNDYYCDWEQYQSFIRAVSDEYARIGPAFVSACLNSELIVDGERTPRESSELYDHENEIFQAAFRYEENRRFLHPKLRQYSLLWSKIPFRQGGSIMMVEAYICCLQTLASRLSINDPNTSSLLDDDCKKVLQPLISMSWYPSGWSNGDWNEILNERVFRCRQEEPGVQRYRKDYIASLAARQGSLTLSEILLPKYLPICWSQTAFPLHNPTDAVLEHTPGKGKPRCITVWLHLAYLKSIAQNLDQDQIGDFLSDLRATYRYLQSKPNASVWAFDLGEDAAVWLNLATLDPKLVLLNEIQECWCSISELVLHSSCDAGSRKTVKPGLMQYSQLLASLGCRSVVYPTVTPPKLHVDHAVSKSLQKLRQSGKLLDITFSTQGHRIQAHRVVLAAISEKCARQFSGVWAVEQVIEFDEKDPDDFLSYHTLSTMINYAYDDEINWDDMKVSENDDESAKEKKLDLLLDLAKGADYWFIPALKSQVEAMILAGGRMLINLKNVDDVKERAELARAAEVENMCNEFIRQNNYLLRTDPVPAVESGW